MTSVERKQPILGATVVQDYLALMHQQRQEMFTSLVGLTEQAIWYRPTPKTWSIGEHLDHLRVINGRTLKQLKFLFRLERPWADRKRHKPYEVIIDNMYKRPNFPMHTGWIWPPKYKPDNPISLSALMANLTAIHNKADQFFSSTDPDLLGHVVLWDPVMGWANLIQTLRIGIYHDELHYEEIVSRLPVLPEGIQNK